MPVSPHTSLSSHHYLIPSVSFQHLADGRGRTGRRMGGGGGRTADGLFCRVAWHSFDTEPSRHHLDLHLCATIILGLPLLLPGHSMVILPTAALGWRHYPGDAPPAHRPRAYAGAAALHDGLSLRVHGITTAHVLARGCSGAHGRGWPGPVHHHTDIS